MPRGLDVHGAACVRGAARKGGGQGVVTHVQLLQFVNHGWVGEQRGQARQAAPKAVGGIAACSRPRSKRSRRRGEGVLGTPGQRTHGNLAGTWAASWVRGPGRLTWEPGQNLVDARENEVPGSLEALRAVGGHACGRAAPRGGGGGAAGAASANRPCTCTCRRGWQAGCGRTIKGEGRGGRSRPPAPRHGRPPTCHQRPHVLQPHIGRQRKLQRALDELRGGGVLQALQQLGLVHGIVGLQGTARQVRGEVGVGGWGPGSQSTFSACTAINAPLPLVLLSPADGWSACPLPPPPPKRCPLTCMYSSMTRS